MPRCRSSWLRRGQRHRPQLYCYRPLTGAFIRERLGRLARLASYAPAAQALAEVTGLDAYLRSRGEQRIPRDGRDRADATLRTFLDRVFEDSSDFELTDERFARAYDELESAVEERGKPTVTLVVGLPGVVIQSPEVELADGLTLCLADAIPDAPPDAAWLGARDDRPNTLAVLRMVDAVSADAAPARLQRLVRSLRLYESGAVGLAPVAWARLDAGAWQLVDLHGGSPSRTGPPLEIGPEREDELRAFISLTARRMPRGGELAWALRRFDLACERQAPARRSPTSCSRSRAARARGAAERPAADGGAVRARGGPARAESRSARRSVRARRRRRARGVRTSSPSTCARCSATRCAVTSTRTCARPRTACSRSRRRR